MKYFFLSIFLLFASDSFAQNNGILLRAGSGTSVKVLPTASSGLVLTANGTGVAPSWASPVTNIGIGSAISGGTPGAILYVDAAGHLAQDAANLDWDYSTFTLEVPNLNVVTGAFAINSVPYIFPASQGGASTVLTNDGSGNLSWVSAGGGGGGLVNWIDSINTAGVNNPIPAIAFVVKTNSTDADAVIESKGSGAILAQIPNDQISRGAKRGANSVDFQIERASSLQVAGGGVCFIGSGYANSIGSSSSASSIVGGELNVMGGSDAVISGGTLNQVSGDRSAIIGGSQLKLNGMDQFGYVGSHANLSSAEFDVAPNNIGLFGNVDIWLANNRDTASALLFFAPSSSIGTFDSSAIKYTGLKSSDTTSVSVIYKLPPHDGIPGQPLVTDGFGNTSWGNFKDTSAPNDPANTTSATMVMMGNGFTFTPQSSGKVLFIICGSIGNGTSGQSSQCTIAYGTGTIPLHGDAATGTIIDGSPITALSTGTNDWRPFSVSYVVAGLTINTTYWVDLQYRTLGGGTAIAKAIKFSGIELP